MASSKPGAKDKEDASAIAEVQALQLRLLKSELANRAADVERLQKELQEKSDEAARWKTEAFRGVTAGLTPPASATTAATLTLSATSLPIVEPQQQHHHHHGAQKQLAAVQEQLRAAEGETTQLKEALQLATAQRDQATQTVAAVRDEAKTLQADRQLLVHEIAQLKEELAQRGQTVQDLNELVRQMSEQLQLLTEKVADTAAEQKAVRSVREASEDKELRRKFNLPESDVLLEYYSASNGAMHSGYLYVTSEHICWETSATLKLLYGDGVMVVPIKDIQSIDKVSPLVPGYLWSSVTITTRAGRAIHFRGLGQRKELVRNIITQAQRLHHKIDVLRDGKPDQKQ